ncbi:MAG: topoisomerase [Alphaproteobacteria bacterium]|jgi:DNA topoisomerase-1|nr:topoisomerase [Alphaproteobacteria bacterium]
MKNVVIVESPAKAKTINRYLGKDFTVLASFGHIRDLPSKNGSVRPEESFAMTWETDERAKKHIAEIAKAVRGADHLYLATDPDREGEAISWHVQQVLSERGDLSPQTNVHRIVFHEITKTAVQHALAHPRAINQELVEAYLARRALDYLVGFTLSPVLWRKLPGSRSAGRVQSVALRLVVEREAEIEVFKPQEYWSITAQLMTPRKEKFIGRLTHLNGKKLDKFDLSTQSQAEAACEAVQQQDLSVATLEKRQAKRHPAAPFITSTLQQEASRKLGYGASRTMQLAQRLYEGVDIGGETTGLITYMRTDSIQIANEALGAARDYIERSYGKPYLPPSPRVFKNKSKNAQEAHEAIRPTEVSRRPEDVRGYLDEAQFKLYELIWKRTVASQMESALFDQVTVEMASPNKQIILRATGSTMTFDGFLKLYQEGVDEDSDKDEEDRLLPILSMGEAISQNQVTPNQHFTQPPPRYSEASLVKKLEELGIGRPSTYASIIHVLQERDYVRLEKRQFIPEERGRLVTTFLVNFFNKYVQYGFTADLEEELDEISQGHLPWKTVLTRFWGPFYETADATQNLRTTEVIDRLEHDLSFHLFPGEDETTRVCPTCKTGRVSLKLSRFGAFLGCSNYPDCRYTRPLSANADEAAAAAPEEPKEMGNDPDTEEVITLRKGPYGYYLQWGDETTVSAQKAVKKEAKEEEAPKKGKGTKKKKAAKSTKPKPKRVSLPATTAPDDVTLEMALQLKRLPFVVGEHPDSGQRLSVGLGRFGPYVKFGDQFASIPKTYDFLALTLEEAVHIVNAKIQKGVSGTRPKRGKFGGAKKGAAKGKTAKPE